MSTTTLSQTSKSTHRNRHLKEISTSISRFKSKVISFKGGLTIFCFLILCLLPIMWSDTAGSYYLCFMVTAMLLSILAASWDFLAGYAGLISFGQAVFFGFAGYISGMMFRFYGWMKFPAILFGAFASMIFGLVIALVCLRLKGPYLALTLLSLGITMQLLYSMQSMAKWFYGVEGITQLSPISSNAIEEYFIVLVIMVISLGVMKIFGQSKFGTVLNAIRDDDVGAEASGINLTKYKTMAFMVSSFFAGLAGAIFAFHNYSVNPSNYGATFSFYAILMAAIGGLGTISGAAVGAFLFVILERVLLELSQMAVIQSVPWLAAMFSAGPLFFFSIILIIIIRYAPNGVLNPAIEKLRLAWELLKGN